MKKLRITEANIREILLLIGFASLMKGMWMIYQPAMWLIGGIILIWFGFPGKGVTR